MFTIGVFAIIINKDNKVLLSHRRDMDLWNLPGGSLEKGETPWEGVIREVKEESGLLVKVLHLQGLYSKPDSDEIVFSFICEIIGGRLLSLTEESDDNRYFNLNEIPSNFSPKQLERIIDYYENIGKDKTVMKVQKGKSSKYYRKEEK
jgi:ADP-ribose pyrophosphatase YjhB (NUDIX family)